MPDGLGGWCRFCQQVSTCGGTYTLCWVGFGTYRQDAPCGSNLLLTHILPLLSHCFTLPQCTKLEPLQAFEGKKHSCIASLLKRQGRVRQQNGKQASGAAQQQRSNSSGEWQPPGPSSGSLQPGNPGLPPPVHPNAPQLHPGATAAAAAAAQGGQAGGAAGQDALAGLLASLGEKAATEHMCTSVHACATACRCPTGLHAPSAVLCGCTTTRRMACWRHVMLIMPRSICTPCRSWTSKAAIARPAQF